MSVHDVDYFVQGLMRRYRQRVPDVARVVAHMVSKGLVEQESDIENDHIAFRTLAVPNLGIRSLEKIFLHHGFQRRDAYDFPVKKLNAFWYSPPSPHLPRVFISELRVDELSEQAQKIIRSCTDVVTADPVDQIDLDDASAIDEFLHRPLWPSVSWPRYEVLTAESEYAAWAIYNRYYLNHFTISVHNLPAPFNTIPQFNRLVEAAGIQLNDSGGKAKTSRDGLLIQSSTVAHMVDATFDDGNGNQVSRKIPGSYVEFAERRPLPQFAALAASQIRPEHRRDGFEAANADRIFESTYSHQTMKSTPTD